jgi:hypothetical protein
MLKMVFFKKRYFYDDFLKNFAIFFVIVFSFSLAARPLLSFFFPFLTCQGSSRVSTVLFALYLSLFFFFPLFLPLVGLCCLEAEVHTKAVLNWKGS